MTTHDPVPDVRSRRTSSRPRTAVTVVIAALASALLLLLGVGAPSAQAAEPDVALGAAQSYGVFGAAVTSTGTTVVNGDLGVATAGGAITGFPTGVVLGTTRSGDAAASAAFAAAYADAAGRTPADHLAGDQAGNTILPGVHAFGAAFGLSGQLTLDGGGDPNAVFVFQINGALNTAAGSAIVLTNGAQASHVYWQSLGAAGTGAGSSFSGTILSNGAITLGASGTLTGRALAVGAITLASNAINVPVAAAPVVPAPVVALAIDGGATETTTSSTPIIRGTADNAAGATVRVTIDGQTVRGLVQPDGTWSVTSPSLVNGTYPVAASVTALGTTRTATQVLTVSAPLPLVTITGGPAASTGDSSPTITGTSDVAPGSTVDVTVAGQALTSTVTPDGHWAVTPADLSDGPHDVVATVTDAAGNVGTATQVLTVDATAPLITINGGATARTSDTTPLLSGTTDAAVGSVVTVTVDGQSVTTVVRPDGTWNVVSRQLTDGSHVVGAAVANADGVVGRASQDLVVDDVIPVVAIDGGPAASTHTSDPPITPAVPVVTVTRTALADAHVAVAGNGLPFTGFDLVTGWYGWGMVLLGGLTLALGRTRVTTAPKIRS